MINMKISTNVTRPAKINHLSANYTWLDIFSSERCSRMLLVLKESPLNSAFVV